ncbi:hypothetical protein Mal4_16120 [Maioricimonas rarisocia]|uniref:Uncharacterized protein n=1 Tax=Maioricimonas rarisocia TaxID=2528026 RepID=A0A517Z484_9PLAN|nr:hypothetical protein Mal4_16120 [Maioricimonas rarisocia]
MGQTFLSAWYSAATDGPSSRLEAHPSKCRLGLVPALLQIRPGAAAMCPVRSQGEASTPEDSGADIPVCLCRHIRSRDTTQGRQPQGAMPSRRRRVGMRSAPAPAYSLAADGPGPGERIRVAPVARQPGSRSDTRHPRSSSYISCRVPRFCEPCEFSVKQPPRKTVGQTFLSAWYSAATSGPSSRLTSLLRT